MRLFTQSLSGVIVPVIVSIVLAACGSSPGGSDYGGGGADTTKPVTSVDTAAGSVSRYQVITFSCTDNSSGCKETWLSGELSGDPAQFVKVYDVNLSGSSTSYSIQISGSHTVGSTYTYQFYSVDISNNQENTNSRNYYIQN